jgi:hypothetical protein
VSSREVLDRYFNQEPPFAASGALGNFSVALARKYGLARHEAAYLNPSWLSKPGERESR